MLPHLLGESGVEAGAGGAKLHLLRATCLPVPPTTTVPLSFPYRSTAYRIPSGGIKRSTPPSSLLSSSYVYTKPVLPSGGIRHRKTFGSREAPPFGRRTSPRDPRG